jgi:dihydroxy-acid dehydratase
VGGPLALVRDGDRVTLDVEARRIDLDIGDEELARRKAAWKAPAPKFTRGFGVLYLQHVQQADTGCDFDFLAPDYAGPAAPGEPEIH